MPFARGIDTLGTELTYDPGDYAGLLDKALAAFGWDKVRQDPRAAAASKAKRSAPASPSLSKRAVSGPTTACAQPWTPGGTVEVVTPGAASVGQGVETVVAQICADTLGVDYRNVCGSYTGRPTASPSAWAHSRRGSRS